MSRHNRHRSPKAGGALDLTIRGDRLEHERIQLEHNLQNTDLSLRLSSQDDDSVEYPRHTSNQDSFPEFRSFINRSRDFDDSDMHHAWSYRTMEEDDSNAIDPYGQSVSTAAHHASGLTLTAGLGGRNRRDVSLSGAEFDPERPLGDLVNGLDSKLSIFDADPSRSRYTAPHQNLTFDPLVVDDSAELDEILESGRVPAQNRSVRLQSHHSSSSSDSEAPNSPRPKISDALRRVSFSPKRPRSPRIASAQLPGPSTRVAPSPLRRGGPTLFIDEDDIPTPKPQRTRPPMNQTPHPLVRVQPATPSSATSKFTKMAKGLTRDLEEEVDRTRRNGREQSFDDRPRATPRKSSMKQQPFVGNVSKSRLFLPDVTGLTSAVESPRKGGLGHYPFNASKEARENDARLLSAISAVQSKLRQLEDENGVSRRRVRELEHELELCKIEVARERSFLIQREEMVEQQQREQEAEDHRRRKGKGKAKARELSMYNEDSSRYQEIVEEKKALEALVKSLRSHLSRLTNELSSHQSLLTELRNLRESDHKALKEKSTEVDRLRQDVERLAGEIEVLRDVVEEGLKERRHARENSTRTSEASAAPELEREFEDEPEQEQEVEHDQEEPDNRLPEMQSHADDSSSESEEVVSMEQPSRANLRAADKSMATAGSMRQSQSRFIDDEELEQISADVDERRSRSMSQAQDEYDRSVSQIQSERSRNIPQMQNERSRNMSQMQNERSRNISRAASERSRSQSPPQFDPISVIERQHSLEVQQDDLEEDEDVEAQRMSSPLPPRQRAGPSQQPARPAAPTPGHAKRSRRRYQQQQDPEESAFPQIRGAKLEKLFFSAPDHNAKTCTVCCKQRRNDRDDEAPRTWLPSHLGKGIHQVDDTFADSDGEDDEGFEEGSVDVDEELLLKQAAGKLPFSTKNGTPPQTVLMKVIRELEDDFTHYKGVWIELADQYKIMDAVSNVPKRKLVERHMREVQDILEQKADQIVNLYDLLTFKDKPLPSGTGKMRRTATVA